MVHFTPLPRCTPAQAGLDPRRIMTMVDAYQAQGHAIHSFLLVRHGKVLCEGYYAPYGPEQLQSVFSLSKTFTSMAVGIAAGEGRISLDARVIDIFPEELAASGVTPGPELNALTLRHLLRMSTGQLEEPNGDEAWEDMRVAFLRQPFTDMPGEVFRYNTMATYMLSAALNKQGIDLEDYLQEKLLTPLGVTGTRWQRDGHGICMGGFGFSLVPELIAKLGVLILNNGKWEGRQLVPREYLALATRPQIYQPPIEQLGESEWHGGYGYQMWMCPNGCFRGDGMYGQLCIMDRRTDTVLAMTAITSDMGQEMRIYYDHVLAAYQPEPLPEDATAMAALNARLACLKDEHTLPEDDGSPIPAGLLGTFADLTLGMDGSVPLLTTEGATLRLGRGAFIHNRVAPVLTGAAFRDMETLTLAEAACGMKDGALTIRVFDAELMLEATVTLTPKDGGVCLHIQNTTDSRHPYTMFEGMVK